MKEQIVLVFDVGTQSTRALLFNKNGNLIDFTRYDEPPYFSKEDNFAEKSCLAYWSGICYVSQELKKKVGKDIWDSIIAVSVTTIRNSLVFLDSEGNQTRNAILWLDKRIAKCKDKLPLINRAMFKLVGMTEVIRVSRMTSYTNWVRINQPEVWAKTAKITMPSAWFNFKLTGRLADSKASQAAKFPYDYKKKTWQTKFSPTFPVFGCPLDKMCELEEPGSILGRITAECAEATGINEGIPVIAGGADKACETIGVGCNDSHTASVSYGTASSVEIVTKKYVEPENFMPAYTSVVPGYYNPEVQIFRGYWMVTWFKEQFGLYEKLEAEKRGVKPEVVLDETLSSVPVGASGLMVQPYWGPGLTTPEAKGLIFGFSDVHTRPYIYRAIIEGLGYALLEGLENMERRAKTKIDRIALSGGGSQSEIICQITADIFGREVYRVQTHETSGLGAAIICFVGMSVYHDYEEAIDKMVHFRDKFLPNMENNKIYRIYFERVYKRIYKSMRPVYYELYDVLDEFYESSQKELFCSINKSDKED